MRRQEASLEPEYEARKTDFFFPPMFVTVQAPLERNCNLFELITQLVGSLMIFY